MTYQICSAPASPEMRGDYDGPFWSRMPPLSIDQCRPESSTHRPLVHARLAHNTTCLFGIFHVRDRYVRCIRTEFQSEVWKDSCVEIFLQPPGGRYFNFEFNCGGAVRCSCRPVDGSGRPHVLTFEQGQAIGIAHSLPSVIDPEISGEQLWTLEFSIPLRVFEESLGASLRFSESTWKGNLFKCGDETSHPHWLSWSPVPEVNFHRPDCFGDLVFA